MWVESRPGWRVLVSIDAVVWPAVEEQVALERRVSLRSVVVWALLARVQGHKMSERAIGRTLSLALAHRGVLADRGYPAIALARGGGYPSLRAVNSILSPLRRWPGYRRALFPVPGRVDVGVRAPVRMV